MTDLNLIDTDTLAAACRTAAVSSAHADLLNAAAARLLAQASWIDGAKVDLDGYDEALAEAERLTCRHHLSSDGDEGPVVNLPGLRVVRWHCNECDGKWYDDNALAHLRDTIRSQTDSLNAAEAEVERLRETMALAESVFMAEARASGQYEAERDDWRRRYEALRDAVLALCDAPDGAFMAAYVLVPRIREVVARVEGDES